MIRSFGRLRFSLILTAALLAATASCLFAQEKPTAPGVLPEGGDSNPVLTLSRESPDVPGVTTSEIVIGQWAPRMGPEAPWGASARGMEAYFKWVNDNGGVHGRKIRLITIWQGEDFEEALNDAQLLDRRRQVFMYAGGVGVKMNQEMLNFLSVRKTPWVGPFSGIAAFTSPPEEFIFTLYPYDRFEAASLVKYCIDVLNRTRIVMFYQDDEYGREGFKGALNQMKASGREFLVEPIAVSEDLDLREKLMEVKDAEPDCIMLWLNPATAVTLRKMDKALVKAGDETGTDPLWTAGSALADTDYMHRVTGGLWDGTVFSNFRELPDSDNEKMKTFRKIFKKYGARGEKWGVYYYSGLGCAETLAEALNAAGPDLTRRKFIEAMETLTNYNTIFGPVTFGPDVRNGASNIYIAQAMEKGRVRLLTGWYTQEKIGIKVPLQ